MTTDRDLRDLLSTEADGPTRSAAGWDDVLQRGRRHRRVVRARQGLAAGGVAVIVALVALTLGQLHTDDQQGVVTNQPDSTTRPAVDDAPTTTRPAGLAALPDLRSARASGVFVTLIINPSDPSAGVDPCTQESALVVETATDVTVRIQNHRELPEHQVWWAACQSSAFSGWATVELTDPLGTRRLIDAGDGLEIPVIDNADLLFPTWIPAPFDIAHWDEMGGEMLVDRTFSWSQSDLTLNIRNSPLEQPVPLGKNPGDGCTGDPVTVRGTQGSLCQSASGSSFTLMWDEAGWRREIDLGPVSDNTNPFTRADLMAIANGLEPLG